MRENTITNHYGVWVGSEQPTTGVLANHDAEWLHEEFYNGVNLTYEEALQEYLDNPETFLEYGIENEEDFNDQYEEQGDTYIIGAWVKDSEGLYEPDLSGEYSAIVRESTTQVVHSWYIERAELCSPCYPGQASLGSGGADGQVYRAFTLPPSLWGDGIDNERRQAIKAETLLYWAEEYTRAVSEYLAHRLPIRRVKELTERIGKVLGELNK